MIIFVSSLFPGPISDKELTWECSLLNLLEPGDCVMADRGFDIEEDLTLHSVCLNITPFLKGKKQFLDKEPIATQ